MRTVGVVALVALLLVVTGCGSAEHPALPATNLAVSSPALSATQAIPVRFTCDGKNLSIPLAWTNVPPHTAELFLILGNAKTIKHRPTIDFYNWGVAGINPSLHEISTHKLPPGAIVGRNSYGRVGYSICPSQAHLSSQYALQLFALPQSLKVKKGFDIKATRRLIEKNPRLVLAATQATGTYVSHTKRSS